MKQSKTVTIGEEIFTFESGRLAKQADGSCTIRVGDTIILATAVAAKGGLPRGFLPLTVDYKEYTSAAGRIPGGFFKREGRPTEKEIITSRLIDRGLRPLFPEGYQAETQIMCTVLSADGEHDPDILAINGASTALVMSQIPFYNPIGAVRVGLINGEILINPTNSQRDVSDLDLVVSATEEAVVMVEAGANQLSEEKMLECIFRAHEEIQLLIRAQHELFRAAGLSKPRWTVPVDVPQEVYQQVKSDLYAPMKQALFTKGKFARKAAVDQVIEAYLAAIPAEEAARKEHSGKVAHQLEEEILRDSVLHEQRRFDDRRVDEVRDIDIEAGLLPRTHGSALFQRGETQALVSATLGSKRDAQIIEEYEGESLQRFLLHYNFPPFSVGEVKPVRSPGRREIGHGLLARRALTPMLPHEEEFPYTIRVVSDILESNGSSSMATVCGGSLALFDAGVPMLAPVAGVAMGLVKGEGDHFVVLTDIAGQEDHYGDMDFKVAGTREGITALQMDIKISGVTRAIMGKALEQARAGRMHILGLMERVLPEPRRELSKFAPRLHTIHVTKDKIRDLIGPGGKTIRSIIEETGCDIDIEDTGKVIIASPDEQAAARAIQMIERLTEVPELGKVYTGTVRRVESYGAFVEILPGTDGLLHVSEIAPYRVREVADELSEGDEVTVKVLSIDETGKIRLSRKAVIMESPDFNPADYPEPEGGSERPSGPREGGRGDRGGRGGMPPRGGFRGREGGGRRNGGGGRSAPRP
ncbi:MAG: polyribonucleotide nucleotidyltransferase [Thermoanaerobaculia bacterium]